MRKPPAPRRPNSTPCRTLNTEIAFSATVLPSTMIVNRPNRSGTCETCIGTDWMAFVASSGVASSTPSATAQTRYRAGTGTASEAHHTSTASPNSVRYRLVRGRAAATCRCARA